MTRTRLIVLLCFVAAFVAGLAAGVVLGRAAPPRRSRRTWLDRELNLTPRQKEQMGEIWSRVISGAAHQQFRDRRRALEGEREQAIRGLLSDEQRQKYEEVIKDYEEKLAALDAERRKLFEDAVERTKQILTEPQRRKYEAILEARAGPRWRRGPPHGGGRFPGGERSHGPPSRKPHEGEPAPPPPPSDLP